MFPWADIMYAADANFWKYNQEVVQNFNGRKISITARSMNYGAREIWPASDNEAKGLGRALIHRGLNSGYQAINLAYLLGAKTIVLLGYDMAHTFGRRHCHADHPHPLGNAEGVDAWLPRFDQLAADLLSVGVSVVNCTRYSRLKCFPRLTIERFLDDHG